MRPVFLGIMPYRIYSRLLADRVAGRTVLGAVALLGVGMASPAYSLTPELVGMMERCAPGVHPITLSAVVRQESSGNPYAIGVNGGAQLARQPRTREEAVATALKLKRQGIDFDSGLGQVNVRNVGWLGVSVADLFDPCVNLRSAAAVLTDCYGRATKAGIRGQAAIHAALSCYNTGTLTRGLANGYVAKVAAKAGALPERGTSAPASAPSTVAALRSDRGNADVFGAASGDAFGAELK